MAQPFGVGDVVGGRYRITHHVVTSADQDIVFQATDEVLDRDVSVLLAARSNAKQVATSAKELATGERSSEVQVLDLGLAQERTYLISSLVDPNQLLDLVVPDAAPYVEPYFTDSLGSELFGQSRQMEPQTYDDDAEYYAQLQPGREGAQQGASTGGRFSRRRPAFLDKVRPAAAGNPAAAGAEEESDPLVEVEDPVFGLSTDLDEVPADPARDTSETIEASSEWQPQAAVEGDDFAAYDMDAPVVERDPSSAFSTVAVGSVAAAARTSSADDAVAEGEEVVDDPPEEPQAEFDPRPPENPAHPRTSEEEAAPLRPLFAPDGEHPSSFTGLISAVPAQARNAFPSAQDAGGEGGHAPPTNAPDTAPASAPASASAYAAASAPERRRPVLGGWVAAAVLAAIVLAAALVIFFTLRSGDDGADAPAPEPAEQEPAEEEAQDQDGGDTDAATDEDDVETETSPSPEDTSPAPALVTVSRDVPESPGLNAGADGQLPGLVDGSADTFWTTQSFATANFGGFASAMNLVAELEEPAEVSQVSLVTQGGFQGGSFEVLLSDSASASGANAIGTGSFDSANATVSAEPTQASFVIIRITELPQETSPTVAGMPFRLQVAEIEVS